MNENRSPIPSRLYNAAVGGHVCGPDDIDFGQKVVHLIKYDKDGNEVSFESQVTQANKIYVIHDDFILNNNVTIPANCILEFDGGSISGAYTITGTNTDINAGLVKIFNTNVILAGTWNVAEAYPEWFGAKGDGITNDSNAIKSICKLKNVTIKFSDKTYIVEIETGTSPDDRRILCSCYANALIGEGNATIKLSDNDNCNKAANRGFNTLFYFSRLTYIVTIKGLSFDYNYNHNIIHHAHSNNEEGYLQNIICSVAAFDECAGFIMRDCNVIDFSGAGVIQSFLSDRHFTDNNGVMYAEVSNCKFSGVGKSSIYNGELAIHDCSIIGVHLDGRREHQKLNRHLKVVIRDNVFEGVGGNAFNTAELCGDEIYFENNHIEGFCYGLLPLASTGNSYCCIKNNIFNKVKKAAGLWNIYMNTTKEFDDVGFKTIDISNNQILFDILYECQMPRFSTINNKSIITIGDVEKKIYTEGSNLGFGVLFTSVLPNRGCGDIIVFNNNIKTINYNGIPYSLFNNVNAVVSFGLPNNNPEYATVDRVLIDNNNIEFQGKLFRNICYREIKYFQITNNSIKCDLNIDPGFKNVGIVWGKVKSDYEGDYSSGISNVLIKDNLIYGSYPAVISNGAFKGTEDGHIVMRNNKAESRILAVVPSDYNSYDVDVFSSKEIQKSEMTANLGSVVKVGDSYYNTTIKRPVWWNGTKWVDERGVAANYAAAITRPILTGSDTGAIFYDTQMLKLITWDGEKWVLSDVLRGTTTERNNLNLDVYNSGFLFWDLNLLKLCVWNGSGWIEPDGSKLDIPRSGTFANKPTVALHNPKVGFAYFCTDRQTTEGATDGIIIYHKGSNVWVDALGRVVS